MTVPEHLLPRENQVWRLRDSFKALRVAMEPLLGRMEDAATHLDHAFCWLICKL